MEASAARLNLTGSSGRSRAGLPSVRLVGPGVDLALPLDSDMPDLTGGFANIEDVDRADKRPITHFTGLTTTRMTVPILLDGFADDLDQQPVLSQVLALAAPTGDPVTLTATGPIPLSGHQWWIDDLALGDLARNTAGVLVRQALVLTFVEPELGDVLPAAVAPGKGGKGGGSPASKKTYTTKKGDTLIKIANALYGSPVEAKAIGELNGIRDTRKVLAAGRELRLPFTFGLTTNLGK
jgi:nucleoid-associated protein YgaU